MLTSDPPAAGQQRQGDGGGDCGAASPSCPLLLSSGRSPSPAEEGEEEGEGEEVIAFPLCCNWQQQEALKQPMEPIPEDEEEAAAAAFVSPPPSPSSGGTLARSLFSPPPPSILELPASSSIITVTISSPPAEEDGANGGGATDQSGAESSNSKSDNSNREPTDKRVLESRKRLKEVYTTEEIDTLVSTLPKEAVPLEWENFSSEQVVVEPKMAHTYVTELAGGMPSSRGTKYSYTYESRVEEEEDGTTTGGGLPGAAAGSSASVAEERRTTAAEEAEAAAEAKEEEEGLERHSTSTQKITRVTKITTTRSVKQIPVGPEDIYFDADGNPILNGFDDQQHPAPDGEDDADDLSPTTAAALGVDPGVGIDLSRTFISEREQFCYSSPPTTSSDGRRPRQQQQQRRTHSAATPSAPEMPQVTGLTESSVSLAWLRPAFDGTAGPLIGYRVEFRRSPLDEWEPAHDDLLGESECKITNLEPDEPYQFRTLGANIAGFGLPSESSQPVRLREMLMRSASGSGLDAADGELAPPPPPGRPQVTAVDGNRATIEWRPSLADASVSSVNGGGAMAMAAAAGASKATGGGGSPVVIGYLVEYRAAGTSGGGWTPANERPTREHRFQVLNLRPNGEYEFRVLARDNEGRHSASPSSGFVRIRPAVPVRQPGGGGGGAQQQQQPLSGWLDAAPEPPGEPKELESGPNWVHLHWEAAKAASTAIGGGRPPLAYLVEMRELDEPRWTRLADQQITPQRGTTAERVALTTSMDHFIVENLLPDSPGYQFRVWTVSLLNGLASTCPSPLSETIRLRPVQAGGGSIDWSSTAAGPSGATAGGGGASRRPERPSAPEYLDYDGGTSLTLCWLPARSILPVQGYEVEFRDLMQDATHWYKMTDQLVQACKTTVGYLLGGHQYQFRVRAKNAAGLSEPSDPSPLVTVGASGEQFSVLLETHGHGQVPLVDELDGRRESPPLPDRDDSPPPIYRQTESSLQWRDPTLKEVIDYLKSPDETLVQDASGYLQHLTFNNDLIKEETRNYGGIECLIVLLRSANPEILRNACGCLKNLAYGKANNENKRLINQKGGIKALAHLLRSSQSALVHEEATGALWNISSADELKEAVLNQAAEAVIRNAVLPSAAATAAQQPQAQQQPAGRNPTANVFRNGTGILRNISAVNDQARRFLRNATGLVDALLDFLQGAVQRGQLDTRGTENVVCLLRNLSYRVQEVADPKYDPKRARYQMMHNHQHQQQSAQNGFSPSVRSERSKSAPSGSPKGKKGDKMSRRERDKEAAAAERRDSEGMAQTTGPRRLWHPSTVCLYLRVLQESDQMEVLEASAAAIQNLAGCPFEGSAQVRQTARTEKGLLILIELLRLKEERVICALAGALRNLALDQRNLELIGKYALGELLCKLPDPVEQQQQPAMVPNAGTSGGSETTTAATIVPPPPAANGTVTATLSAILGILWEVVRHSAEMAKAVHETAQGTQRLRTLARACPPYERKVCKYATQVLYMMWQHKELHELFRRSGLGEADFYSGTLHRGGGGGGKHQQHGGREPPMASSSFVGKQQSPSSMTTTLARPFSSQGMERPANLALAQQQTLLDDSFADSGRYGSPQQLQQQMIHSDRATASPAGHPPPPSSSGAIPKPPRQSQVKQQQPNSNGLLSYEPSPLVDHLYAQVHRGNGGAATAANQSSGSAAAAGGRRLSIDSWV